jgi:protein phosphatase
LERIGLDTEGTLALTVASRTHVGCVRKNNEDSLGVVLGEATARGSLLVVADGMGGAAAGEVASGIAVKSVEERYLDPAIDGKACDVLRDALAIANGAIYDRATKHPELHGMGTTCTAVVVLGQQVCFAHVGDSRAYLFVGDRFRQLTTDHSLAAEYERQGGVGGAPARARNVLTRCLGVRPDVRIDVSEQPVPLPVDSSLVLCSDGLTNMVGDGEIHQLVSMHGPESACQRLVQLALERGAPDNVTVVVARVSSAERAAG